MNKQYCDICPINCHIDRSQNTGLCEAPQKLKINTAMLHFGEEPVISGTTGSGTVFFSHCNMKCVYCQNYKISAKGAGTEIEDAQFIETALNLQDKGATNINLVSPTPYTQRLIPILETLKKSGLHIPIVWNSNAYEKVETIKMLEGLVDIYLPDFRYYDDEVAQKYSGITNYRQHAQAAIKEMVRQTGKLSIDEDGIAIFGTLIRILVLPNDINDTKSILKWIHKELGNETYISLMSQYYPAYNAKNFTEINRGINPKEYQELIKEMEILKLENGFIQKPATTPEWTPDFK